MDSVNNDFRIGSLTNQEKTREVKDNAVLDQEDFLKIIAANISNPPIPGSEGGSGSETDFMGQMIQMNLLEQVTSLNESIQSTMLMTHQQQSLSLVGKTVKVNTVKDEKPLEIIGEVTKVRFTPNGMATVQVDGEEYFLQDVTEVGEVTPTPKPEKPGETEKPAEGGGSQNAE